MCDILPQEMWLNVFKQMNPDDLFEKRKVCKDFKKIVDDNLKFFYLHYAKQYPVYLPFKEEVTIDDLINVHTKFFIEGLSKHDCSRYFIRKMQHDNLTLFQVRLVLDLYLNHGIQYYAGIKIAHVQQPELGRILNLKNNGFPIFFASKFGTHPELTEEKMETLKKLKSMEISDYFCGKLTFEYTESQLLTFYEKLQEKTMKPYNIIYLIDSELL